MILYLETNLLVGCAKGQIAAVSVDKLLAIPASDLRLVLPDICVMEAWAHIARERSTRLRFSEQLKQQINLFKEDKQSLNAQRMVQHLQQAKVTNLEWMNDVETRLIEILRRICDPAPPFRSVELLSLTCAVTGGVVSTPSIPNQPKDSLILSVITEDAQNNPNEEKAFLSGNFKDFDSDKGNKAQIKAHIQSLAIKFWTELDHFLSSFDARTV